MSDIDRVVRETTIQQRTPSPPVSTEAGSTLVTQSPLTVTSPLNVAMSTISGGMTRGDSPASSDTEGILVTFRKRGETYGLTGIELASFVREEMSRREEREERNQERRQRLKMENQQRIDEREDRLRREERQEALRREEFVRQETLHREEMERQEALRREELDVFRQCVGDRTTTEGTRSLGNSGDYFKFKPEVYDEKEDIDVYLLHFERNAIAHKWPKECWGRRLATVLRGKAKVAYLRLEPAESASYDVIKRTLLEEFHRTPAFYCKQFRNMRKEPEENFKQYLKRLKTSMDRWLQLAEVDRTDPEAMYDIFLKEQLVSIFSPELAQHVLEKGKSSAAQAAEFAFLHIEAKREAKSTSAGVVSRDPPVRPRLEVKKGSDRPKEEKKAKSFRTAATNAEPGKGSTSRRDPKDLICFRCKIKGHLARNCPAPAVANSVCTARVGRHGISEAATLCEDCEGKSFQPECISFIGGKRAQSLRDTGADNVFVRSDFVKPEDYTGDTRDAEMADYGFKRNYPVAVVDIDSPFVQGRLLAIVVEHIRPDIFIGNSAQREDGEWIEIPVFPQKNRLQAVTTRAQQRQDTTTKVMPVATVDGLGITPDRLKELQEQDATLLRARQTAKEATTLQAGTNTKTFRYSKGVLKRCFKDKSGEHTQVCVPKTLRASVMRLAHDTPMAGHLGAKKTQERIWAVFYWPGMCGDIRRYCQSCDRCQKITPKGRVRKVPLGHMPLPFIPFERVAVDLVGPIKPASSSGNRYILVMVDQATRYPEATPLKNVEAKTVAEALFNMWTRLGVPGQVLSDRGGQFTGRVMTEVHRLLCIKGRTTTPYHAQCNGQVERFNGTLKTMLRKLCVEDPRTWDRFIPAVLFAYREVPHEGSGFSPFELLYGRTVRGPMAILRDMWTREQDPTAPLPASAYVFELRNKIEETCKIARQSLEKEAVRQKKHFDRKARVRVFSEGQRVLLLLPCKHNKLEMAWRGPYVIEERVGECDYRVKIKGKSKLLHANLLKLYLEPSAILATVAVIDDWEEWEEVRTTHEDIPLIQLTAEETIADIHLDPEAPEIHEGIQRIAALRERVLTDLPLRVTLTKCEMKLAHDEPVRTKQFPLPFSKREVIGKEVKEMLRMGVIEHSNSPYSSPIVLVAKPDGKVRFCSDYRRVNRIVEFDAEPMPNVDFLFTKLNRAKYLSKIDLTKGYWQVPMEEADKPKTAFTTPQGCFQWTVMPFGLKTAGAIFSRMMRALLQPLGMEEVENFMDDILVATETKERHLECLGSLFARLDEVNLSAKPSKCYLGFRQLEYLGHVVGHGVIQPVEGKMDKIRNAVRPTTKRQIRGFLGLAGFYRRFVPHFSDIALPLTNATKGDRPNTVQWNEELEVAFDTLKEKLTTEPICVLPDMTKPFVLRTDASGFGIGAVLLQDQGEGLKMVACASKKLLPAEQNYSTIERECLAIVWGIRRFSPYIWGTHFVIQSDHQPLEFLQTMKATNKRVMRWALCLQSYSFTVQAIPGVENVGADFLSRIDE